MNILSAIVKWYVHPFRIKNCVSEQGKPVEIDFVLEPPDHQWALAVSPENKKGWSLTKRHHKETTKSPSYCPALLYGASLSPLKTGVAVASATIIMHYGKHCKKRIAIFACLWLTK